MSTAVAKKSGGKKGAPGGGRWIMTGHGPIFIGGFGKKGDKSRSSPTQVATPSPSPLSSVAPAGHLAHKLPTHLHETYKQTYTRSLDALKKHDTADHSKAPTLSEDRTRDESRAMADYIASSRHSSEMAAREVLSVHTMGVMGGITESLANGMSHSAGALAIQHRIQKMGISDTPPYHYKGGQLERAAEEQHDLRVAMRVQGHPPDHEKEDVTYVLPVRDVGVNYGEDEKSPVGYMQDDVSSLYAISHKTGDVFITRPSAKTGTRFDKVGNVDEMMVQYYAHTQATMAHRGVKEETLYRGVTKKQADVIKGGGIVATNALSSWAHDKGVAHGFAQHDGVVLSSKMPADRILMSDKHSPYGAGIGNTETEAVLFGKMYMPGTLTMTEPDLRYI